MTLLPEKSRRVVWRANISSPRTRIVWSPITLQLLRTLGSRKPPPDVVLYEAIAVWVDGSAATMFKPG